MGRESMTMKVERFNPQAADIGGADRKTGDLVQGTTRILLDRHFGIAKVIFNPPKTIVYWSGGGKTIATCAKSDRWSELAGLGACLAKRAYGSGERAHAAIENAVACAQRQGAAR